MLISREVEITYEHIAEATKALSQRSNGYGPSAYRECRSCPLAIASNMSVGFEKAAYPDWLNATDYYLLDETGKQFTRDWTDRLPVSPCIITLTRIEPEH